MHNNKSGLITVIIICVVFMIYWHHSPHEYLTIYKIVPQNVISSIFSSIIGACIVLLTFNS
jgi:uncharacterized membrane protein YeaQ/YmgE (transglycosylase-associated protein family)